MGDRGQDRRELLDRRMLTQAGHRRSNDVRLVVREGSEAPGIVGAAFTSLATTPRGMSDDVLLIVTAEMGRSPKRNNRGGRDHYGELTPLMLYGGGLKMGQVIGSSDSRAERPATRPYDPKNLLATVMHVLFDVPQLRLRTDLPREFSDLFAYEPIRELI